MESFRASHSSVSMSFADANRRRSPRCDARDLRVQLVSPQHFQVLGARDLSSGGFSIYCNVPLEKGLVCEFSIEAPNGMKVTATARLMHSQASDDPTGPFVSGWEFECVLPPDSDRLPRWGDRVRR